MNALHPGSRRHVAAFLLTILLAGCVSTRDRFEKGQELEAEGRYAEAASYYVRVLQHEPSWEEARRRLADTGARAVDDALAAARAAEAAADYEAAVDALASLEELRGEAAGVGVPLEAPADVDAFRRRLVEEAAALLVRRGEAAEAAGRWQEALRAYERVQERYAAPELAAAMTDARARVLVRWGGQELERGRYRAAYDRAAQALRLLGPDAAAGAPARRLQDDALSAGTRAVVFLPPGSTDAVAREAPRGLVKALGDVLQYEHWAEPPLFVASVDPAELHRELRRLRADRDRITERQASEIGRTLEADEVVLVDLTAFSWREAERQEERRTARTRGSNAVDTAYVVERYRVDVRGEVAFAVLDPVTRAVVERGTVSADASDRFERGRYAGDARDLDLPRRDRSLFDRDALDESEQELEDAFVDALAERVARRVYEVLARRTP